MSIPKSKILSSGRSNGVNVSRGVMALAKIKRDTNQCENVQNNQVNINIKPTPDGDALIVNKNGVSTVVDKNEVVEVSVVNERSIESAAETVTDIESLVAEKDAINKALSLILDLVESNPLKINSYIVPHESVFTELIQVLTQADKIEIEYKEFEVTCCGFGSNDGDYSIADQVYITKDNALTALKYDYPDVIKLLDTHNVSYKMIVRDSA